MLTELSIKDFAIIDELTLSFKEGMTVLTGETGAGKSIIIDAVQLLSGGRGSVEFVRYGTKKATLQGLFTVDDQKHTIFQIAERYGIEMDVDGMVILHRTITANGKSICRVNGTLVTLAILKEFGKTLIDIHTQHETQSLMDVERHLPLLDLFDKKIMDEAKSDYQHVFQRLSKVRQRLQKLNNNEQEIAQRLDLLKFQLNEIETVQLQPDEDDTLRNEREKLINFEKIFNAVQDAYNALYGDQKALDWLSHALTALDSASDFEEELKQKKESFANNFYLIEELSYDLRSYLDGYEFDPERLNFLEGRLSDIKRLTKKYGATVDDVLIYSAKISDEIDQLEDRDSSILKLANEVEELSQDALVEAQHLHDLRTKAAKQLIIAIEIELQDLYLEKATFDVQIETKQGKDGDVEIDGKPVQLGVQGYDQVKFLLSTNPGEPVKEMHKVASGGELSRIMLALKKTFASHQGVTSVIFDEVDTGVSGRVAQAIAEKIHQISSGSQVLCITHLPQVAAMADTHVLIEKMTTENQTKTTVKDLSKQERTEEIGRMITGTELTVTSQEHARELIDFAEQFKD